MREVGVQIMSVHGVCSFSFVCGCHQTVSENNSVNVLFHSHGTVRWLARHSVWAAALVLAVSLSASMLVSSKLASSRTQLATERIIARIDLMVDSAVQANQVVRTWLPSLQRVPCGPVSARLREFVASRPYIRSLTVWERGSYRCSSVFGGISGRVDSPLPHHGHAARLLEGNQLTPNSGVLLISTATGPAQGVIGAISANYLEHALEAAPGTDAWLEVGGQRLTLLAGQVVVQPVSAARTCERRRPDRHALVTLVVADACAPAWIARLLTADVWKVSVPLTLLVLGALLYIRRAEVGRQCRAVLDALRAGQLTPHYQPIFSLADGNIRGAEVLVRWRHPTRGAISPEVFVPLLEAMGKTPLLTAYVLRRAAEDLLQGHWRLPEDFYLSVNISPRELLDRRLVNAVRQFKRAAPHCGLALEITERESLAASPALRAHVMLLSAMGVRLLLDDFGTGYAGLGYLTLLRIDCVKIDKSFVEQLEGHNETAQRILAVIVDLCASLSMTVIAEGIETSEQRAYLRRQGVTHGQGYVMAPALSASEIARFLAMPE